MRFLIVKTSSLGDIVQSFEFLEYLKQKYPDSIVDWVVEKRWCEIIKSHPLVDRIIEIQTPPKNFSVSKQSMKQLRLYSYDVAFDIQGNSKSGIVLFFSRAKEKVGFKKVTEWMNLLFTSKKISIPDGMDIRQDYLHVLKKYFEDDSTQLYTNFSLLNITEEEKIFIDSTLNFAKDKKKIIVAPGSRWNNKCLDRGHLLAFLRSFNEPTLFIFTHGSEDELRDCNYLNEHLKNQSIILERCSLPCLQNLMSRVDLVISVDSLPLHLAATTKVKTLSFFGPSSSQKYAPNGPNHISFQGSCPYAVSFTKRCPKLRTCETGDCIKNLRPLELVKKDKSSF